MGWGMSRAKATRALLRWDRYLNKVYPPSGDNYRHHWGYHRSAFRYREKTSWNLTMRVRRGRHPQPSSGGDEAAA